MKDLYIIVVNLIFFFLWKYKNTIEDKFKKSIWNIKIGKVLFLCLNIIYGIIISKDINIWINKFVITKLNLDEKGIKFNSLISKTINDENFIPIIIGAISLMLALFIYIVSESDNLKKELIKTAIDIKKLMYLSLILFTFMFFNGRSIFLISGYLYILILMYDSFRIKIVINKNIYSKEKLDFLMKKIEKTTNEQKEGIYLEIRNKFSESINNNNSVYLENTIKFWEKFIESNFKFIEKESYEKNIIITIQEIYELVYEKRNHRIFRKCCMLHEDLAGKSYEEKNEDLFLRALYLNRETYKYYTKADEINKKLLEVWIIPKNYLEDIVKDFNKEKNIQKGIEWLIYYFRGINFCIEETLRNNDYYFFDIYLGNLKKYVYLNEFNRKYVRLLQAEYFGILLLFDKKEYKNLSKKFQNNLKRRIIDISRDIYEYYDYTDRLINLILFVHENNLYDRFKWGEIYIPECHPIYGASGVETPGFYVNRLFFTLFYEYFGGVGNDKIIEDLNEFYKNKKLTKEIVSNFLICLDKKKISKEVKNKFKPVFENFKEKFEIEEKEQIAKEKISIRKIEKMKGIIAKILKTNWILDIFFKDKIVKELVEKHTKGKNIGVFLPKGIFLEKSKYGNGESVFENYAKNLNSDVGNLLVEKLKERTNSQDKKELIEAIGDIPESKTIIISGKMRTFTRKYKENIKREYQLSQEQKEKYGEEIMGLFNDNIPIYYFHMGKEGIFLIEDGIFKKITQYKSNEEEVSSDYIYEDNVELARMRIRAYEGFSKDEGFNLQEYENDEDKLREIKTQVEFCLMYHFEVELDKTKKVIEIEVDEEEQGE